MATQNTANNNDSEQHVTERMATQNTANNNDSEQHVTERMATQNTANNDSEQHVASHCFFATTRSSNHTVTLSSKSSKYDKT